MTDRNRTAEQTAALTALVNKSIFDSIQTKNAMALGIRRDEIEGMIERALGFVLLGLVGSAGLEADAIAVALVEARQETERAERWADRRAETNRRDEADDVRAAEYSR